jgi:membrane-associated phospholipid phosphatase
VQQVESDTNGKDMVNRTFAGAALAALLVSGGISGRAAAQTDSTSSASHKTFFTAHDAAVGGVFLAASAGLSVFDARIAQYFQDTAHFHVRAGQKLDSYFTHINETTLTVGGLGVYAVAKLLHQQTVADVAFHMAESVAAASLTAQVIRGPLGRTRPKDAADPYKDQYEFHFMQGFSHFQQRAFPSIHSSSGFAAASALVAEVKQRSPGATWWVGVPAYALALTPGLSRMYLGQHWASDIFSGAFLGTFYGWRVVDYSHAHPTTRIDRIFLGTVTNSRIGFDSHGASMQLNFTF